MAKLDFDSSSPIPVILCPIIYFIFTPLLISVYIFNEIVRRIVAIVLWYKHGNQVELIEDGCDSIWNYKIKGNTRTCLLVGTTQRGAFDPDDFADYFEKHVLLHKERRATRFGKTKYRPYQKLEKIMVTSHGYTCWKYDDKFSIKNHVRRLKDRALYTENDLMEVMSVLAEDMDESKPQWEFLFIDNYQDRDGREKSIFVFRFHHAYLDGLSVLTMFKRYFSPNVTLPLDPLNVTIEPWKKLIYYANTLIYAPYKFITMMMNRNALYWKTAQGVTRLSGKKNYATIPPIGMDVIKNIRKDTGASVPNIVCTAFLSAAKRVLPPERIPPGFIRVGEMVARVPYPNADPQNRFAPFSYDLSTEDIGESAEDFADAISSLRRRRLVGMVGPEPLLFTFVTQFIGRLPTFVLPLIINGIHNSIFYSNVPAFKEKLIFYGAEVEDFCGWPPMPNETGIILASVSCGGILKITGVADSAWLSSEELQKIFIEIPKIIDGVAEKGFIPIHYFPQESYPPHRNNSADQRMYSFEESSSDVGEYQIQNHVEEVPVENSGASEDEQLIEDEGDDKENNVEGLSFQKLSNVDGTMIKTANILPESGSLAESYPNGHDSE